MPNICENYVYITGPEEVLAVMESRDFHWFNYFPDMEERGGTRMGSSRGDNAPPIRLLRNGIGGIEAYFISAWCPPLEFYNRLVESVANIRLEYEYHEWRMGFAGFGVAGSMEPTHFSYECSEDVVSMLEAHSWHLVIENPFITACSSGERPDSEEECFDTDDDRAPN